MVNDGSPRDATGEIPAEGGRRARDYRHLRLPKNRGQAAALGAGLHRARGRFVVTMDGDGQNDRRHSGARALLDIKPTWWSEFASGGATPSCAARCRSSPTRSAAGCSTTGCRKRCALKVFRREVVPVLLAAEDPLLVHAGRCEGRGFRSRSCR